MVPKANDVIRNSSTFAIKRIESNSIDERRYISSFKFVIAEKLHDFNVESKAVVKVGIQKFAVTVGASAYRNQITFTHW